MEDFGYFVKIAKDRNPGANIQDLYKIARDLGIAKEWEKVGEKLFSVMTKTGKKVPTEFLKWLKQPRWFANRRLGTLMDVSGIPRGTQVENQLRGWLEARTLPKRLLTGRRASRIAQSNIEDLVVNWERGGRKGYYERAGNKGQFHKKQPPKPPPTKPEDWVTQMSKRSPKELAILGASGLLGATTLGGMFDIGATR